MITGKFPAGENIVCEVVGDTLVLTIDLKAQAVPSATGKTLLVASTRGAVPVSYPSLPGLKGLGECDDSGALAGRRRAAGSRSSG
jgi:hypothetical protein